MVNLKYKNKPWLKAQYGELYRSEADIAEECGVSQSCIHYWVKKYKIVGSKAKKKLVEGYSDVDAQKISKEMEMAGSPGEWAQEEAKARYAKRRYLADLYVEQSKFDLAAEQMTAAEKILTDMMPSRSKIDAKPPIKGPTSDDHEAIIKLNSMLKQIEKDFNEVRGEKTIVEGGWNNRPKLSVHSSPREMERDIQEESLADE